MSADLRCALARPGLSPSSYMGGIWDTACSFIMCSVTLTRQGTAEAVRGDCNADG